MNNPTKENMHVVYRILRYIKGIFGEGCTSRNQRKETLKYSQKLVREAQKLTRDRLSLCGEIWSLGEVKSNFFFRERKPASSFK